MHGSYMYQRGVMAKTLRECSQLFWSNNSYYSAADGLFDHNVLSRDINFLPYQEISVQTGHTDS